MVLNRIENKKKYMYKLDAEIEDNEIKSATILLGFDPYGPRDDENHQWEMSKVFLHSDHNVSGPHSWWNEDDKKQVHLEVQKLNTNKDVTYILYSGNVKCEQKQTVYSVCRHLEKYCRWYAAMYYNNFDEHIDEPIFRLPNNKQKVRRFEED